MFACVCARLSSVRCIRFVFEPACVCVCVRVCACVRVRETKSLRLLFLFPVSLTFAPSSPLYIDLAGPRIDTTKDMIRGGRRGFLGDTALAR